MSASILDRAISPAEAVDSNRARDSKPGHVYFILDPSADVVKIGFAIDLGARIASIQTCNYQELELLYSFSAEKACEAAIHGYLAEHRLRGEWFRYVSAIDSLIDDIEHEREERVPSDFWWEDAYLSPEHIAWAFNKRPVADIPPIVCHRPAVDEVNSGDGGAR